MEEQYEDDASLAHLLQKEFQINELILKANHKSSNIDLFVPKTEEREVYVVAVDENEKPIKDVEGNYSFMKRTVPIFDKWETKTVKIPAPELFTSDLILSVLSERDREKLASIHRLYARLVIAMIKDGKNYSRVVWYLAQNAATLIETSRAKSGTTLNLTKTQITQGQTMNTIVQQMKEEQERKGILSKLWKKKNDEGDPQ